MSLSWFQIGWVILSIFQIGVAFHFLYLYRIDNDKRKLIFSIAFFIGVFSVLYTALGIHKTDAEILYLRNLYYWSSLPIMFAIFSLAHYSLLNFKKIDVFYKLFMFIILTSLILFTFYPAPADETFSIIIIVISFETLIVSLVLFILRRSISELIFLLAVVSFMIGGLSISRDLEPYFQIFAFFMGYIFILLIFAYPTSSISKDQKGMGTIFKLQEKLAQTTENLKTTEEQYKDLFENIKSGVAVYEPIENGNDFVLKGFNNAAERIENISRDQVIGRRVTEVFPGVKEFGIFDVFKEVWETGKSKNHPISYYQDGNIHGWRDNTVYKLSTGEIVAVYDDVTEDKKREIALQNAHNHLKKMNEELDKMVEQRTEEVHHLLKQKDDFINQLGHDLKNPLGPLINLLPVLEKTESDPKKKEILDVLIRNVGYMKNLVLKTIELASLNSSNVTFHFQQVKLNDIIQNSIETNRLLLEEKSIKIELQVFEEIWVNADPLRIEELMNNLITNAVKYNVVGGCIRIDAKSENNFVVVSVHDSGIGLTQNQINHIFDEFYKVDESRHDFDSSGLGMSICKRIVEKHGGMIWVESSGPEKGSTFFFKLPKISFKKISQNEIISNN